MSGFSAEWLALREPYDAAARAADLVALLARPAGGARSRRALTRSRAAASDGLARAGTEAARSIVDLGAGTGANLRWLAPRLGGTQAWHLVDRDAALLAAVERGLEDWASSCGAQLGSQGEVLSVRGATFECSVRRTALDLRADLARLEIPAGALVAASALLDLVSADWLEALARRCRDAAADVCFALTYDGRSICSPSAPADSEALDLFNRHQRTDKGFGAALGATAAPRATEVLEQLGYRVTARSSDWRLGPGAAEIQRALLAGWLAAALEIAPRRRAALEAWHLERLAHVDAGRSELVVGHVDLVGRLGEPKG